MAATKEMNVLIANRLADVAIGSDPRTGPDEPALALVTDTIFRYRLVVVTAGQSRLRGGPRQWLWFVDPSGTDPDSEIGQMLSSLGRDERPHKGSENSRRSDHGGLERRLERRDRGQLQSAAQPVKTSVQRY